MRDHLNVITWANHYDRPIKNSHFFLLGLLNDVSWPYLQAQNLESGTCFHCHAKYSVQVTLRLCMDSGNDLP
jgi:hypothetical protein